LNAAYGFSPDAQALIHHKINLANHECGVFTAGNRLPVFEMSRSMLFIQSAFSGGISPENA
jgi:hypothetical protein